MSDFVTQDLYLQCRERCNDRCEQCQKQIDELKSAEKECKDAMDDKFSSVDNKLDTIKSDIADLKTDGKLNNLKWMGMSALGSLIGGILVIVIAAALIMHFGIAQPQMNIDHNAKPAAIERQAPTPAGAVYADTLEPAKPIEVKRREIPKYQVAIKDGKLSIQREEVNEISINRKDQ